MVVAALTWHPKRAYLAAAACKGGDVVLARRCLSDSVQRDFETQQIIAGVCTEIDIIQLALAFDLCHVHVYKNF